MTCLKDSLSNEPSLICSEIELTIVSFVASQHPELCGSCPFKAYTLVRNSQLSNLSVM